MQENNITTKLKTNGKMKWVGYGCLVFAAILSVLMIYTDSDIDMDLIAYWGGTGITLLIANSGKRLLGYGVEKVKPINLNNMEDDVK